MDEQQLTEDCRLAPRPNVHARRFDDEMVVLDLTEGVYFALDELAAAMWEGFVAGRSIREVARALAPSYEVPEAKLLEDARAFAYELTRTGLATLRRGAP